MTRVVLISKSTFIHEGELYKPGDPILLPTRDAVSAREKSSASFREANLVEAPEPSVHANVEVARGGGGLIVRQGGGWYDVTDSDGVLIEESVQGRDNAEAALETYLTEDDGGDSSTDSE